MVTAAVLTLALSVLCWPRAGAAGRLREALNGGNRAGGRRRLPRPGTVAVAVGLGAAGGVLLGVGAGLAATIAGATGWRHWAARRTLRDTLDAVAALAEALRSVVGELRAGAHPADAADSAAVDAEPYPARVMRAIAAAARLDGDVDRALAGCRAALPAAAPVLHQLSRAWTLVQRHGLPLAEVLDAVRGDLDARVRFARQVLARMAGPRASATVLALLPVVGVALGEAMGARPLDTLTTTVAGQGVLVVGVALACAGLAWSARLTGQVVLR
jgi:tight adherence protein B